MPATRGEISKMKTIIRLAFVAIILSLIGLPHVVATPTVEDQPRMQEALDLLRQARHKLEQALPDKGGHRTAAIKACDEAIKQTDEGIKYGSEDHGDHGK